LHTIFYPLLANDCYDVMPAEFFKKNIVYSTCLLIF
jgi:hypothetical protein